MRCPFCASTENRVLDSRMARDGRAIRRRRQCDPCEGRFTTYETIEETRPDVTKNGGHSEPFDRDKLLRSLRLACKKRPIGLEVLTDFVHRLEANVASLPRRTVTTAVVGDQVLNFLRTQDPVAYVRYASVYRSFGSVEEFMNELLTLQNSPDDDPEVGS